jgi:heme/copper-type cytochrome/quinol oxidase subunit 4
LIDWVGVETHFTRSILFHYLYLPLCITIWSPTNSSTRMIVGAHGGRAQSKQKERSDSRQEHLITFQNPITYLLLLISADERLVWSFRLFVLVMVATKRLAFVIQCSLRLDPRNTYQQEWNVTFRIFRLAFAVVTLAESLLRLFENLTCKRH